MIEIEHNRSEGTLVTGTDKGDGAGAILHRHGFRYSAPIEAWYLPHSRQKAAKTGVIDTAARQLREAGYKATIAIDNVTPGRPFTVVEAERLELAEDRAERYSGYAKGAEASAETHQAWAEERLSHIPPGQPILADHYSANRDRRQRERIDAKLTYAVNERARARYWHARASAAARFRAGRYDLPTTLRRIEALETERRDLNRQFSEARQSTPRADRLAADLDYVDEQLEYWRGVVDAAEADGQKVWRRADFAKGDFAKIDGQWMQVLRVNPKTVTIPWVGAAARCDEPIVTKAIAATYRGGHRTYTVPYDRITGHMSAARAAACLDAERTA